MINRRFYKLEHNDKDEGFDSSSSSSSDSEPEVEAQQEDEEEVVGPHAEEEVPEANEEKPSSPSFGSGYESEDSSEKELEYDSSDAKRVHLKLQKTGEAPDKAKAKDPAKHLSKKRRKDRD
ncbi:hypothetical protein IFM89_033602 [Coptis chinensis]|uniref:Uncharacterized protein n=1 Tax=Coptis chinensis TaxID=261450 RepID=A0A835I7V7_9MAGN|nr:hypothetical protein IFM89_033602 [Coptis chinensis]